MSKRNKIFQLLVENDLTTKEIHEITGYDKDLIWQYVNQFKSEDKIKKVGNKGRFNIYTAKDKNDFQNETTKKMIQGYKQIYNLFNDLIRNSSKMLKKKQLNNFKTMISNHIDIELLKEINEEINLK